MSQPSDAAGGPTYYIPPSPFEQAFNDDHFGDPCRVQRDAWTYWDDAQWNPTMSAAATVFEGGDIMNVSWNDHLGAWLAVYTPPLDQTIYARTARELTGPWSERAAVYTVPGDQAPYDALNHPEFAEDGGRVLYLTYSRATTGWFGREFILLRVRLQ